jgi:hypothetical protein
MLNTDSENISEDSPLTKVHSFCLFGESNQVFLESFVYKKLATAFSGTLHQENYVGETTVPKTN